MRLSARQISAAIALAGTTQDELSSLAGIARPTLNRILNEDVVAKDDTMHKIRQALESRGVEFIGNIGVQWAQHHVRTLAGIEGLKLFFDDVHDDIKREGGDVIICGFSERYFEDKLGDFIDFQRSRMLSLDNFKMRCLVKDNDEALGASDYCEYRWQDDEQFSNVPFYIYGNKLAIIATSAPENPLILIIRNSSIAAAYRKQFEAMWQLSKPSRSGRKP